MTASSNSSAEATIGAVRLAAAHEGVAELIVELAHPNGGRSEVALDHLSTNALLKSCAAGHPDELIGHTWSKVRDAMAVSWNRFNSGPNAGREKSD